MRNKSPEVKKPKINTRPVFLLGVLLLCSFAVYFIYRFFILNFNAKIVLTVYMTVATACILAYVIYNRGFSRKGITADMLPKEWSEEKKTAFIEDGNTRIKKSKPLLIVIIAFIFTFVIELTELFVIPFFEALFASVL